MTRLPADLILEFRVAGLGLKGEREREWGAGGGGRQRDVRMK